MTCRYCEGARDLEQDAPAYGPAHLQAILALAASWRDSCTCKEAMSKLTDHRPHWGFTHQHGFAVHAHTADHLKPQPGDSLYARFNKRVAIWLTKNVGSMTAFWLFTLASMTVAPSCLFAAGYIHWKAFITTFGFELLATLILSTWLELALMPAIMVGQNLQNAASDARAAKQFEDLEEVRDWLDLHTEGGLADVMAEVRKIGEVLKV